MDTHNIIGVGLIVLGAFFLLIGIGYFLLAKSKAKEEKKPFVNIAFVFSILGVIMLAVGIVLASVSEITNTLIITLGCIVLVPFAGSIIFFFIKAITYDHCRDRKKIITFTICLVVIIAAVCLIIFFGNNSQPEVPNEFDQYDIQVIAEQEVEERLKAPSTAKFSNIEVAKSGSTWVVTGYVDAQNSFGAMIRNRFRVEIKDNGYPKYTVVSVEIY